MPILRSLASALLALPFFAACASAPAPDASTGDASTNDAAVADATSTPDAPPADAPAIDAAPRAADCRLVDGVLVGSECLPRCSLRTQMAVEGCGGLRDANSRGCRDFQLSSDSTPPLALPDGDTVTCPSCIQYQSNRCSQMSCPSEYAAVVRCQGAGSSSSCTRERDALSDCLQPFGWACFDRETARCFGAQSTAGGTACLAGVS